MLTPSSSLSLSFLFFCQTRIAAPRAQGSTRPTIPLAKAQPSTRPDTPTPHVRPALLSSSDIFLSTDLRLLSSLDFISSPSNPESSRIKEETARLLLLSPPRRSKLPPHPREQSRLPLPEPNSLQLQVRLLLLSLNSLPSSTNSLPPSKLNKLESRSSLRPTFASPRPSFVFPPRTEISRGASRSCIGL